MVNEGLRRAMVRRGMSAVDLATVVGRDPKTIERWLASEEWTPHARIRWAAAKALEVDEEVLWPQVVSGKVKTGADREVLRVYGGHSAVPPRVWTRLLRDAHDEIMLCGTAWHWLAYYVPNLVTTLERKAKAGCTVRAVIGDASNPIVEMDEKATGSAVTLSARIEQTRRLLAPLRDLVDARSTPLGFGRSVYRGDNVAVADWWEDGASGTEFTVFHLRRQIDGGAFDRMAIRHPESLWSRATPLEW